MQKFGIQRITGPAIEPVSVAIAKRHLRVDFDLDNEYIAALVSAARENVEGQMNRAIFNQTWCLTLDQFPYATSFSTVAPNVRDNYLGYGLYYSWMEISLPWPRLSSIASITSLDGNGDQQTLDPSLYCFDTSSEPARILPANGGSWPYPATYAPGTVKITFVAGTYGDGVMVNTCPAAIKHAILLLVGHWYTNREAVVPGGMANLPLAVDALLAPYKFYGLVL